MITQILLIRYIMFEKVLIELNHFFNLCYNLEIFKNLHSKNMNLLGY